MLSLHHTCLPLDRVRQEHLFITAAYDCAICQMDPADVREHPVPICGGRTWFELCWWIWACPILIISKYFQAFTASGTKSKFPKTRKKNPSIYNQAVKKANHCLNLQTPWVQWRLYSSSLAIGIHIVSTLMIECTPERACIFGRPRISTLDSSRDTQGQKFPEWSTRAAQGAGRWADLSIQLKQCCFGSIKSDLLSQTCWTRSL